MPPAMVEEVCEAAGLLADVSICKNCQSEVYPASFPILGMKGMVQVLRNQTISGLSCLMSDTRFESFDAGATSGG